MSEWINLPENLSDYFAFVYLITNTSPDLPENYPRYYVGKKQIMKKTRLKPKKGMKKSRIVYRDNGVQEYWGSSNDLLADIAKYGKENFKREILHLCKSKWSASYMEAKEQFDRRVLFDPCYYNGILNLRIGKVPKSYLEHGC
mgnify:CR=1 FL=1|tara:strand:- start:21 stop:449 length:429 start_codon:yes stop_codon:yes gene_type:complete